MGSIEDYAPQLMYPAPLAEDCGIRIQAGEQDVDVETPILIVGGGPVGMLQALMFARIHEQDCMIIEREHNTTTYPKMEYTNGRSMEIYRQMGLANEFRSLATQYVPDHATCDEMNVTSMNPGGHHIHNWKRKRAVDHREDSKENNDGSKYLEPHLRAHQILVESWLKIWLQRERRITGLWGHSFVGLVETADGVISEVRQADGTTTRIKSQYVIGCDGGGSYVRKSVGLESKRTYLDMQLAFVHLESGEFRKKLPFGPFWHTNVIHGGIVVAQDEDAVFTIHMVVPPGVDINQLSAQEVVNLACAGTLDPVEIPIDKVFCRGLWKVEVAIANKFRSDQGRVFLTGDAAHQLSPIGGHGLNSGLCDAYDLAWKLVAVMRGWGGDQLLQSYDTERRQIAFKNLATVQEALETIVMPLIANPGLDRVLINEKTPEGEKAREELASGYAEKHWFHDQNGNMLGYQYIDSPVVLAKGETVERPISKNFVYKPTTWPGSRAPHVWLSDGKTSTLDLLSSAKFNLVDFSDGARLGGSLMQAAAELKIPLNTISLDAEVEQNTRKIYETDLVLIRPDGHVAWRIPPGTQQSPSKTEALDILSRVVGL